VDTRQGSLLPPCEHTHLALPHPPCPRRTSATPTLLAKCSPAFLSALCHPSHHPLAEWKQTRAIIFALRIFHSTHARAATCGLTHPCPWLPTASLLSQYARWLHYQAQQFVVAPSPVIRHAAAKYMPIIHLVSFCKSLLWANVCGACVPVCHGPHPLPFLPAPEGGVQSPANQRRFACAAYTCQSVPQPSCVLCSSGKGRGAGAFVFF
jgi:hypothetical protein